jgi:hypothetical protein
MDVVKVELNSNGEDESLSSHHQGELSNTNVAALPVTLPVLKVESQVSISGWALCVILFKY